MQSPNSVDFISPMSDEELVALLREAPTSAAAPDWYRELFHRHHRRVASWCLRFTGEREAALDLAQEVFVKAYRRLEAFRGDSKFSTWLYIIARNHCLTAAKKWATEPAQMGHSVSLHLLDVRSASVHDTVEREQLLGLMRQWMVEALDETEAQVVNLHYYQELPLDSVTRLLNLSNPSGAKAYVVSARRKLAAAAQCWKQRRANTVTA
jgi:RNA polymerase sigma-70 factor (ECF subfamily)